MKIELPTIQSNIVVEGEVITNKKSQSMDENTYLVIAIAQVLFLFFEGATSYHSFMAPAAGIMKRIQQYAMELSKGQVTTLEL